jgi:lon-related putative ATP-dependent protease
MSLEESARLNPDDLRFQFDKDLVPWNSTREVPACSEIIGQERALRAIRLGLELKSAGYNVFVTGLSGTGKMTTIKTLLEEIDHSGRLPEDLCYVHNFKHPENPRILRLPLGGGKNLQKDMAHLVEYLRVHVPEILESDAFKNKWEQLVEDAHVKEREQIRKFEQRVKEQNFSLVQVQYGSIQRTELVPLIVDNPKNLAELEDLVEQGKFAREEFERIKGVHRQLSGEMDEVTKQIKNLQKEVAEQQQVLVREIMRPILDEMLGEIRHRFPWEPVDSYLEDVSADILDRIDIFREKQEDKSNFLAALMTPREAGDPFLPFEVNVVVDNSDLTGVPIIIETSPTYRNIFGTIEKSVDRGGGVKTDFTRIRAGSLLRANGGYLVLNAMDALLEPEVYKNLKRALKYNKVTIQSFDPFFMFSSTFITPEPIDIDVKVVMIGDKEIYHVLFQLDEDFHKIFKVLADFDSVMANTSSNVNCFVALMSKICEEENLLSFDQQGICAVLEHAVRLAGRKNKLSTRFSDVADLLREANFWASREQAAVVTRSHVEKAEREKNFRSNLPEERLQELIEEETILIDTTGGKVGQVNGLSVYQLGYYTFGKPTRLTAEVSLGEAGVINIERESGLSGRTHDKGVLIMGNFLRSRYTRDKPLSMNASICFEQSYGGVDGDSASSTEVYAILSALSGLPIRQDLAVTGSVNQKGRIQPIGGVNEKIEGFFDICAARSFTGTQGVLIPRQNVADLMLRQNIVEAVRQGQFHIYAVDTIDEGIELLTGVPAGQKDDRGAWPEDSVNERVNRTLQDFADTLRQYKHGD